ncbi:MAG: diguanylate cyclase domain-containing protein [Mycobacteriales bacterium]
MNPEPAARALGRLYLAFAILSVVAVFAPAAPDASVSIRQSLTVGCLDLGMAAVCRLLPWGRWPGWRCLLLTAPTVGLVGWCTAIGLLPPRTPSLVFTLLFVWVGSYFPRGASLPVVPCALVSYLGGMLSVPNPSPLRPEAVALMVTVWVLVAETIAAQHAKQQAALEELRFVLDNSNDLICRLDERSIIRYVSPSVTALLGWRAEEMLGRSSASFRHPDDVGSVAGSLASRGEPVTSTRRLRHRDGSYRRMETISRAVPTQRGHSEILTTSRDITDRYHAEQELERRATHDALTDLPNRDVLGRRLTQQLGDPDSSAALLFLDLDGFKAINDSHGHSVGDELLTAVAARLSSLTRSGDSVARFGGDEFVLLLTDLPATDNPLPAVAARVEQALSDPYQLSAVAVSIGCSVGVVAVDPRLTALEILARADAAMYEAKAQRRALR